MIQPFGQIGQLLNNCNNGYINTKMLKNKF